MRWESNFGVALHFQVQWHSTGAGAQCSWFMNGGRLWYCVVSYRNWNRMRNSIIWEDRIEVTTHKNSRMCDWVTDHPVKNRLYFSWCRWVWELGTCCRTMWFLFVVSRCGDYMWLIYIISIPTKVVRRFVLLFSIRETEGRIIFLVYFSLVPGGRAGKIMARIKMTSPLLGIID